MNLQPTFGRVIIKPDAEYSPTKIKIPTAFQKFANRGEVVAVGPGRRHIDGKIYPLPFGVGATVMFSLQNVHKFEDGGQEYVMLEEEGVMAVMTEKVEEN